MRVKRFLSLKNIQYLAPIIVFIFIYILGGVVFTNFFSLRVFLNLLTDNSFLGIVAIGMTIVVLSGGIDLSVGAVMSTSAMIIAVLTKSGTAPLISILLVLLFGLVLGTIMGIFIQYLDVAPFIVTLSGMFFARGFGFVLSLTSIPIEHEFFSKASGLGIEFPSGAKLTLITILFLLLMLIFALVMSFSKWGRAVYALGGNEKAAFLMGVPIGKVKISVYTVSGFCAALAGIVYSFYTLSGYGLAGLGLELDAIAAVVIGGTLLTGGVGLIAGTLVGVLIQGIIQVFIIFQGSMNSYWIKIFIGALLFVFILLQRIIVNYVKKRVK